MNESSPDGSSSRHPNILSLSMSDLASPNRGAWFDETAFDVDADGSTTRIDVEPDRDRLLESGGDEDSLSGTVIAESYVVLHLLGEGAMGRVYEVEHARTGRHLAMKVLRRRMAADPEISKRFVREALAVSKLHSTKSVQIVDHGVSNGVPFMVMELVRGRTLGEILRADGRLGEARALRIAIDVATALGEAHDRGIVHRDIKPDNVMLTLDENGDETVKVLDFGLAKVFAPERIDVVSSAGMVVGTPHYMSPEQIRGSVVDARADVYSVGAVLYRMLTGKRPFGGTVTKVLAAHLTSAPISPELRAPEAGISPAVAELVMQALAKDPADRFQSAAALANAMASVLARADVGGYRGSAEVREADPSAAARLDVGSGVRPGDGEPSDDSGLGRYERRLRKGSRAAQGVVFAVAIALAAIVVWTLLSRGG